MKIPMTLRLLMHPANRILTIIFLCAAIAPAHGATLDEQITQFKDPSTSQTEELVTKLLESGIAEHRCAQAMAVVQPWLNRNHLQATQGILSTAVAAERAGQWDLAIGYYQRLLQTKDVDAKAAGTAVDATYRLLLNSLQDETAAYLFMRKEGNRLRVYGSAKQYDRWFIDQAKKQRDLVAVCNRLAVIAEDKGTDQSRFVQDLKWLCEELEQFKPEPSESYEAAAELSNKNVAAEVKARLRWVATVMPYNQKLDELRDASAPADAKLTDEPIAAAANLLKVNADLATLVAKG
jgi:hypothetical protein